MKKAFTLIEMLVVVAVIATLMTVVFRLSNVADAQERRITTVTRLQKLENCLSGYYAAFGSYPQVKVHGSRDIYTELQNGVQTDRTNSNLDWEQVNAACRSQPVAANYPFPQGMQMAVQVYSDEVKARTESGDYPAYSQSPLAPIFRRGFGIASANELSGYRSCVDWREVQIFRFGLMSYLVPRYLTMMNADGGYYVGGSAGFAQWENNNDLPCDASTGVRFNSWQDVRQNVQPESAANARVVRDFMRVANVPTQAACARWIPNLENECLSWCPVNVFGVSVAGGRSFPLEDDSAPPLEFFSPGGSGSSYYLLDTITVWDGWDRDFYYYSPDGFQSYTLWSAGANGVTFPPWIDIASVATKTMRGTSMTVFDCVRDDIIRMRD